MKLKLILLACFFTVLLAPTVTSRAQGTAFTYQGRLTENGMGASGVYDLRFAIYDAVTGGDAVGRAVTNAAILLSNGVFTVTLDFGANVFTGGERWLDIAVRTNAGASFMALSPRQALLPTPHAVFANTASNLSGTIAVGQLPSAIVTNNQSGVSLRGNFFGDAAGLTNVPGTIPSQVVTDFYVPAQPNTAYDANSVTRVNLFLSTNAIVGDSVQVSGLGSGGWQILASEGQSIQGIPPGIFWLARNNVGFLRAIASSADGNKVVSAGAPGQIRTSQDAGVTWTGHGPFDNWVSVASSADGSRLVGVVINGQIHTSTDGGTNWTARDSVRRWLWVASSADGIRLAAVVWGGQIYTSTNGGTNWVARETGRDWWSIASSADGNKLVAVVDGGQIHTSADGGANWTPRENVRFWRSVTSSADGNKLAAVVVSGQIYTSTDGGINWTPRENQRNWSAIASSADGNRLIALVQDGQIHLSTNSGVNWIAQDTSRNWYAAASSADGSKLFAAVNGGDVYTPIVASTLTGARGSSVELTYAGNGVWQPLNLAQNSASQALLNANQTFTGQNTFNNAANNFTGNGSGLSNLRLTGLSQAGPNWIQSVETSGSELLKLHAWRNLGVEANLDATFWSGRNFLMTAVYDLQLRAMHDMNITVENNFAQNVALTYQLTAGQNINLVAGGNLSLSGSSLFLSSDSSATLNLASHLNATIGNDASITVGDDLNVQANDLSVSSSRFALLPTGAAGFGTPSPAAHLHVYSTGSPTVLRVQSSAQPGAGRIEFLSDPQGSASEWRPAYIQSTDNGGFTGGLSFVVNGTGLANRFAEVEAMRIVNGRVGIGTPTPVSALQVIGTVTATTFTPSSDRNLKENFAPVSPRDVLAKVAALPITSWNFKGDAATPHVGPMAQDFHTAFGLGTDDKHIATVDADGVALAAIQGLNQKIDEKDAEIRNLRVRLEKLERLLSRDVSDAQGK